MDLLYLTAGMPGSGGVIRKKPEDFRVTEIPLYDACGEGEFLFLRVRKRGMGTFEAVRRLGQALQVPEREIGYAGLKDARAVTTQWMSVPAHAEGRVKGLDLPGIWVLEARRHGNKLRIGHLRGNRFSIVVRGVPAGGYERAAAVLDVLLRRGAPNYFGEQRFGARGASHLYGEAILRRDYETFLKRFLGGPPAGERDPRIRRSRDAFEAGRIEEAFESMPMNRRAEKKCLHALLRFRDAERACMAIPKRMRQMYVSSFQSALYNRALEQRLQGLDRLEDGDLAFVHRSHKIFPVAEAANEQDRCRAFEISPSGPIFGTRMLLPEGAPGAMERALLEESRLAVEDFAPQGGLRFDGSRRPLRIPIKEAVLAPDEGDAFRVDFVLPSGSFATAVLREIVKSPEPPPAEALGTTALHST
ncbi:MAG TPA: tRNA pseudouridine(13) synthase TruD [Planctomycetota bacterium]|nr:tRNA pseudouridine(13) synthase TruD [Planctomycetota bacterium]